MKLANNAKSQNVNSNNKSNAASSNNRDQFSIISHYESENDDFKFPQEKAIYSHFTTAIDTNNIKTIFEMVRLMIFEKNCKAIMLN